MSQTFQGSFVAMVTPFRNGKVDEAKLRELVEFHVAHGTNGLIPCGTTGESPGLTHDEHRRIVELVIEAARGRIRVVAGTGFKTSAASLMSFTVSLRMVSASSSGVKAGASAKSPSTTKHNFMNALRNDCSENYPAPSRFSSTTSRAARR